MFAKVLSICKFYQNGYCKSNPHCRKMHKDRVFRSLTKYKACMLYTGKPADCQKRATILAASLVKQSEFLQCEFLWESTDLNRPSSTGRCSLTALGANTIFFALGK